MELFYIIILFPVSLLASAGALALYYRIPDAWLCDYGQTPGVEHRPENRCKDRARAVIVLWIVCLLVLLVSPYTRVADVLYIVAAFLLLAVAALSDCDYRIVPDQCCLGLLLLGLLRCLAGNRWTLKGYLGGVLLAAVLVILSMVLSRMLTRRESIGMGDLKLMASAGGCVGAMRVLHWPTVVVAMYVVAIMASACWFAVLLLAGRTRYDGYRPMAPWIGGAALFCMDAAWYL